MSYDTECTGSATIDRQQTSYGSSVVCSMPIAYGQRFDPTSECLDSITLRMKRIVDYDVDIEIRRDDNGIPSENYLWRYRIPYTSIPTSFSNINIPVGIVLPDAYPKWIVIISEKYDPNYYDETSYFELARDTTTVPIEYLGTKPGTSPWNIYIPSGSLYFQTYKKTYTEPCTIPGCGFVVA